MQANLPSPASMKLGLDHEHAVTEIHAKAGDAVIFTVRNRSAH
eukprot:COSAG04_NODE_777_length_10358_cov_1284.125061_2_plen_43_part_00